MVFLSSESWMKSFIKWNVSIRDIGKTALGVFRLSATVSCLSCADHKVKCAVSKSSARNRRVEVSLRSTATPCCPAECGSITTDVNTYQIWAWRCNEAHFIRYQGVGICCKTFKKLCFGLCVHAGVNNTCDAIFLLYVSRCRGLCCLPPCCTGFILMFSEP